MYTAAVIPTLTNKVSNYLQNYLVLGHFPSSGILETRKQTFRKLDLFQSSGEGGGEGTYSVGSLRQS
jgi:hypothetical protein